MCNAYLLPNGANAEMCTNERKSTIKKKIYMTPICYITLIFTW